MTDASPIAFVDLKAQYNAYRAEIDAAVHAVLDHGKYINGPEVAAFEGALADFAGVAEAVGCSSGTDALLMMMMAITTTETTGTTTAMAMVMATVLVMLMVISTQASRLI